MDLETVATDDSEDKMLETRRRTRGSSISASLATGTSGPEQRWLVAHQDPHAGFYTFSSGITFGDLCGDGDMKLAIADLGNGQTDIKLNVYRGTQLLQKLTLIEVPAGITSFYQDGGPSGSVPALAVAAGHFLFIYRNLRPFYKFQLPFPTVNQTEMETWNQVRDQKIDISVLRDMLQSLKSQVGASELTTLSQRFLSLSTLAEMESFVESNKNEQLRRQTIITCLNTVKKNGNEEEAATCLLVGTEDRDILVIEPDAFTVVASIKLPSVPVFIDAHGLFDVEFRIIISCRDAAIYSLKRGFKSARLCMQLTCHPVAIARMNTYIVVGCMDQTVNCYTTKGNLVWTLKQAATITAMTSITVEMLGIKLIAVALDNHSIIIYQEKHKVDVIEAESTIVAMKFGKYGREGSTLVTVSKQGGICIRILKRTAKFQPKEVDSFDSPQSTVAKLNVPRKTKLYVDQTIREREESTRIHRTFQQDLLRLKLMTARTYVKAVSSSLNPISTSGNNSLKLSAEVHGLGPVFRLVLELRSSDSCNNLFLTFHCNINIYWIERNYIPISHLAPGLAYSYSTRVQCVSELNVADNIKVYVVKKGETIPILTAIINMPASEAPL